VSADPSDASALMDMSVVLQVAGHREKGLAMQEAALRIERCFVQSVGKGDGLRVLVFMTAGDLMANTPIDFLMEGVDATLIMLFVDADTPDLHGLPEHDVAFVAIGESDANQPVLANLARLLRGWDGPVLNRAPERIMRLTRDGVAATFAGEASILAPATQRMRRDALRGAADAKTAFLPGEPFPCIIRPIGTHAGQGLAKIDDWEALRVYLAGREEAEFFVASFIDYRGADGLYRKQRIAFIEGHAFASHLAVSEHWIVHYLSAGMTERAERRAEEEAWMRDFDTDFAVRHATAFEAIHRRIGLDYFAIDCAETRDGQLLLFEVDTAMIVHAMDAEGTFPYKKPAMRKLFAAFQAALQRRAVR
jgi:glutathione synthase/RimK-type ligase-like ATP-grasp enzyme